MDQATGIFGYLRWPWLTLAGCIAIIALAASQLPEFRFDASSDTLVVEGDPDLAAFRSVNDTFGGEEFLFMTFAPADGDPVSEASVTTLAALVEELRSVPYVVGVFSILDAPLLKSPPVELQSLLAGFPTLQTPTTDRALARDELRNSPFFRELLITSDGSASALKIDIEPSKTLLAARAALNAVRAQEGAALEQAERDLRLAKDAEQARRAELISSLRTVRDRYEDQGTLHLGGVPMIAADMISYVQRDLITFGGVVILLVVVALAVFFRRVRWVTLPLLTAAGAVVVTVGLLGALGWQATVISSNFISLLGITTISLTIHLIVHYRELRLTQPDMGAEHLVFATLRAKFMPCFYTAITTIAAFGSLTVSGILPVEDFGWMMCIGILISLIVTFTLFPAVLLLLPKGEAAANLGNSNAFIRWLGTLCRWHPQRIAWMCLALAVAAAIGIAQVSLDNRFAEYFDTDTEIYQGMSYIDRNLGGTIPFDVVLQYPPYEEASDEDDFFDDFDDGFEDEYPERYWYTRDILDRLEKVHRYIEQQPFVGKVLSLTALEDFALEFTGGEKLGSLEIVAILGAVPDDLHAQIIAPYADPRSGQLRIVGRVIESGPVFDREAFRSDIRSFAVQEAGFAEEDVVVTGMMILFNGMLTKLLSSQVNTLAYILAVVFVMFLLLLRSWRHAALGMIPNSLASAMVIGAMGFTGVPLDMMTTTIAAICIGIGVDDTIHYLHRFREELARHGDARIAVAFCHESIGRALYYTSFTVVIGFSVLSFSNFVPTVMFGVWTAIAMLLALLANLTLLPALLVLVHGGPAPVPEVRQDS